MSEQYGTPEPNAMFTRLIDELVESSQSDPELASGIRWIDEQARRNGVSFYEMAADILYGRGTTPHGIRFRN